MSSTFLIADMVSAICNRKDYYRSTFVVVPYSKLNEATLKVFDQKGYISSYEKFEQRKGVFKIKINLSFDNQGRNTVVSFKMLSRPGLRSYVGVDVLKKILKRDWYKITVVSTPKGVFEVNDAIKLGVGGELVCQIAS